MTIKATFFTFLCVIAYSNLFSQGIHFEHSSFNQVLEKAKAENKMVFMDCYTTWCGPCKALAKNVFPDEEVGNEFNKNYISIKMDMESGEGPELLKRYNIKAFPTLLFLDAKGEILFKRVGGCTAKELIDDAKAAADPTQRLEYVQEKYNAGDRSKEIVTKYISLLQKNYMEEEKVKIGQAYLKQLSNNDLLDKSNFEVYTAVEDNIESNKFNFVKSNKEKFIALSSEETVTNFLIMTYYKSMQKATRGSELKTLDNTIKAFRAEFSDPKYNGIRNQMYNSFYINNHQYNKWYTLIDESIKELDPKKSEYENILINAAYKIIIDPTFDKEEGALAKAKEWCGKTIKANEKSISAHSCMAMIYKKENNKTEATKSINKSIALMKDSGLELDKRILSLQTEIKAM